MTVPDELLREGIKLSEAAKLELEARTQICDCDLCNYRWHACNHFPAVAAELLEARKHIAKSKQEACTCQFCDPTNECYDGCVDACAVHGDSHIEGKALKDAKAELLALRERVKELEEMARRNYVYVDDPTPITMGPSPTPLTFVDPDAETSR